MSDQTVAQLPAGWSWSRFDEIGSVSLGRQRSPANHSGPAMRPYVRAANITWTGLDLRDVKQMNFDETDFARFRLESGDVLINEGSGSAAEVGKPAIWRGEIADCCFQNTLLRVKPEACSSEYVFNYIRLCAKRGDFVPSTQGINIYHIGRERLARQTIPVPPQPEQRRIVAKIDSLSAKSKRARDRLDHVPKLAERYRQAVLTAAFRGDLTAKWRAANAVSPVGYENSPQDFSEDLPTLPPSWSWMPVSRISTKVVDGVHKKPTYVEAGIPFLTVRNLTAGPGISFTGCRFISPNDHAEFIKRTNPGKGDILITKDGTLGVVRQVTIDKPFSIFVSLALVKPIDVGMSDYLELAFSSPIMQKQMVGVGSGLQHIHLTDLRKDIVPIAPLAERHEIVNRVRRALTWIDRLAAEATSARELIEHLDQVVLSKAFRGELVPQDPADEPASALLECLRVERGRMAAMKPRRGRPRQATPL